MRLNCEFTSMNDLFNFVKVMAAQQEAISAPVLNEEIDRLQKEVNRYKEAFERTEANLNRAYERLRIVDKDGKTMNKDEHEEEKKTENWTSIGELEIGNRAYNALIAENIQSVESLLTQIMAYPDFLRKIPNVGKLTRKQIQDAIDAYLEKKRHD